MTLARFNAEELRDGPGALDRRRRMIEEEREQTLINRLGVKDIELTAWIRRHARALADAPLIDAYESSSTNEERRGYWREIERRGYAR